jgi:hypothetical protein
MPTGATATTNSRNSRMKKATDGGGQESNYENRSRGLADWVHFITLKDVCIRNNDLHKAIRKLQNMAESEFRSPGT